MSDAAPAGRGGRRWRLAALGLAALGLAALPTVASLATAGHGVATFGWFAYASPTFQRVSLLALQASLWWAWVPTLGVPVLVAAVPLFLRRRWAALAAAAVLGVLALVAFALVLLTGGIHLTPPTTPLMTLDGACYLLAAATLLAASRKAA